MPNTVPKTIDEAKRWAAHAAFADLIGCSEPIDTQPDNYPFNATTVEKVIPKEWVREVHRVIVWVYHHEKLPPDMKGGKDADNAETEAAA